LLSAASVYLTVLYYNYTTVGGDVNSQTLKFSTVTGRAPIRHARCPWGSYLVTLKGWRLAFLSEMGYYLAAS